LHTPNAELFLLVCRTEDALVVGTPYGVLQDKAVGLARRPDDDPLI
jgi:hypothetical protein